MRVRSARSERGYVVNVVGSMVHVAPLSAAPPDGELVAIGMHLDPAAARQRLTAVAQTTAERPDAPGLRRLHRYRRLSD